MTRKDIGSMPDFQVEKLIEFIGTNKKIVEIGTYRGKTARVMAEAGNEVICIDPFEGGYSEDRASQELSEQNDVKKGWNFMFHDYWSRHKGVQLAVDEVIVPKYKPVFKSCSLMGYEK